MLKSVCIRFSDHMDLKREPAYYKLVIIVIPCFLHKTRLVYLNYVSLTQAKQLLLKTYRNVAFSAASG